MKLLTSFIFLFLFTSLVAQAQLRKDLNYEPEVYSGAISHTHNESSGIGNFMNMLNMTMSHSYSMSFSNFAGQTQNINAYTNSMFFDVSDRMNAQVDVSVLHSPFGNSFMNNDMGARIVIDQARIDYQLSSNTNISFQFSQRPYYGYGHGFGNAYSPFNRRSTWY